MATLQAADSNSPGVWSETHVSVRGLKLQTLSGGQGEQLLILHDQDYLNVWYPYLASLAGDYSVLVPSHPGFGQSALPADFESVDDLAYVYLDLLRDLGPVHLMGLGFGGWIAAEMAIRCTHQLKRLILVDALGIKVSGPTTRDITDTFMLSAEEFLKMAWHDAEAGQRIMKVPGLGQLSEEELVALLRNRQTAALLGWKPFMHHPRLRARLERIDLPTLVLWGASDRIVTVEYGKAYAASIPNAEIRIIPAAGHYPYLERPDAFVDAVGQFLQSDRRVAAAAAAGA